MRHLQPSKDSSDQENRSKKKRKKWWTIKNRRKRKQAPRAWRSFRKDWLFSTDRVIVDKVVQALFLWNKYFLFYKQCYVSSLFLRLEDSDRGVLDTKTMVYSVKNDCGTTFFKHGLSYTKLIIKKSRPISNHWVAQFRKGFLFYLQQFNKPKSLKWKILRSKALSSKIPEEEHLEFFPWSCKVEDNIVNWHIVVIQTPFLH